MGLIRTYRPKEREKLVVGQCVDQGARRSILQPKGRVFPSYTPEYSVVHDFVSVPDKSIFPLRETSPNTESITLYRGCRFTQCLFQKIGALQTVAPSCARYTANCKRMIQSQLDAGLSLRHFSTDVFKT